MNLPLAILPSPDQAAIMAWVQLLRTHNKMVRRTEQLLARQNLTLPQFDVLATLNTGDNITQQELAERLLVTKGNVTGILNRMESAEWVERRTDTTDRRNKRIFLTAKGRRLLQRIMPEHDAHLLRATQNLGPGKLQQLYQTLDTLEQNLDQMGT